MAAGVVGGVQVSCGDGRVGLVDGVPLAVGGKRTPLWESLHACVEALMWNFFDLCTCGNGNVVHAFHVMEWHALTGAM